MTTTKNDARLNFRLRSDLKILIERAATRSGQSMSEFAVSTLVRTAQEVLEEHDRTELSNRDREIFLAMLEGVDAQPNQALQRAAQQYKREFD